MQQFQEQQQFAQNEMHQVVQNSHGRSRGRAKAYTQGSKVTGGRGPSGNKAGSGSRHVDSFRQFEAGRTGSKKRSQKTRSSLNVAGGMPLNMAGSLGLGPQSLAVLPSNMSKQKKITAQIYGSGNMLSSLIS